MRQLACILVTLAIVGVYGDEPDKLVNGIPTTIEENPYCVSLRINNSHFCGGSIIDSQYILTAGHCVAPLLSNDSLRKSVIVVTGTTYLDKGGQTHKVEKLWYHDNYNPRILGRSPHDIGLIKLMSPIEFGPTQKSVKLPTKNVAKSDSVTIAAWGSTGSNKSVHNNLQKLKANVMLPNTCQIYHSFIMKIYKNEFCTFITKGIGLCKGDSGSGLIQDSDETIIGLVSGGKPCAKGYPDVYTNIYPYLSWIQGKITLEALSCFYCLIKQLLIVPPPRSPLSMLYPSIATAEAMTGMTNDNGKQRSYGDEMARLVNGKSTTIQENPHCAFIKMFGEYMCGGNIISKQHILTAAHCVYDLYHNYETLLKSTTIVTGTTYINKGGVVHKVKKVYYHERYNPSVLGVNDIGVIKLLKTIQFGPTQQQIMLPTSNIAMNEDVMIVAWGRQGFQKPVHNNLQKLNMKIILPTTCQARYDKSSLIIHIDKNTFCTYIKNGIGTCNGDSGSGVIRTHDKKIIGLVSGGIPCAKGYPDIQSNVYSYKKWIEQKMLL
ncbi:PREDICTED: transmembrane protease serine 9-like [Cyphomyrmex costatus]|uniref:transmembrane protease serine 9-like n=1 Tax=Cyphomyrmex costatus TaxID=456900 RepID=UPI0008523C5E|nr:PREDICTED: transmembrane protease serine 9-like [Cyphomyrmex costatus]